MNKSIRVLIMFIIAFLLVVTSTWKNDSLGTSVEEAVFTAVLVPVTPVVVAGDSTPRQKYIFVEFFAGL